MAKKKAKQDVSAKKRHRRNDEEMIRDLKSRIDELKQRQEARKGASDDQRHIAAAHASVRQKRRQQERQQQRDEHGLRIASQRLDGQ